VLAGDLLGTPDDLSTIEEAQRRSAREILGILTPLKVPVFYIMGNDDLVELEPASSQFQSIHGRRVDLGPYNLVGYQFSPPFMGGYLREAGGRDWRRPLRPRIVDGQQDRSGHPQSR